MLSASWNEEFDDNISLPAFRAAMLVVVKSGVTHNKNIRLVPVKQLSDTKLDQNSSRSTKVDHI